MTIEGTDDMVTWLTSLGVEADIASAKVEQVRVPKKWDDSFSAFNEVLRAGGFDLARCRGKTVEKWDLVAPNRSAGDQTVSAILLVRKKQLVGAYRIARPSGEVTPLTAAPTPSAPPTAAAKDAAADAAAAAAQPQSAAAADLTPEQLAQLSAAGASAGLTPEQIAAAAAAIESAAQQPGAQPSE